MGSSVALKPPDVSEQDGAVLVSGRPGGAGINLLACSKALKPCINLISSLTLFSCGEVVIRTLMSSAIAYTNGQAITCLLKKDPTGFAKVILLVQPKSF